MANLVILIIAFHVGYGTTSQQIPIKDMETCKAVRKAILQEWNDGDAMRGYPGEAGGICVSVPK